MPEKWPHVAGRLVPGGHVLPVRIYFEDTDFSGIVYHASYLRFMERGRTDWLRLLGVSHEELDRGDHGERLAFAVRRMEIDFLKPARIDDLVEVETVTAKSSGARIILQQTIRRDGAVLVDATVTVVLVAENGRPRRLPASLREKLGMPEEG
jgi:acyl-CoA thioester hydrolase